MDTHQQPAAAKARLHTLAGGTGSLSGKSPFHGFLAWGRMSKHLRTEQESKSFPSTEPEMAGDGKGVHIPRSRDATISGMSTKSTSKKKPVYGWRVLILACGGVVLAVGAVAKGVMKDGGSGSQSTINVNIFQINVTNTVSGRDSATTPVAQQ
jgi:hypothetical protein